jgi:hypothetical protein
MTFMIWIVVSLALAAQNPTPASQRFDYLVRADFFAGVAGDEARLDKAIELCEHALEQNPSHAEALVWHGAGLLASPGSIAPRSSTSRSCRSCFPRSTAACWSG